jgi:hypothetical protein
LFIGFDRCYQCCYGFKLMYCWVFFWVVIKLRVEGGSPLSITRECPCLKVIILILNSLYTPQVGLLVIVIEVFLSNKVTSTGIFIWIVFIAVFLDQTAVLQLIFDTLFFWIKIKLEFLWPYIIEGFSCLVSSLSFSNEPYLW